jgi:hypothetical protein
MAGKSPFWQQGAGRQAVSTVIVPRQERREAPDMPRGEIALEPPPEIPEVAADGLQQMLTYMPMLAMTFGMVAMMSGSGSGALRWVGGGAMGVGMGGMAVGQLVRGRGDRKIRLNGQRRDYLRYFGQVRRKVRRAARAQRDALEWSSPLPAALWWVMVAGQRARLWERRPQDADFGSIRLGTSTQHLAVRLIPPQARPAEDLDPLCAGALRRFIRTHARVPELPVGMSLRSFSRVAVAGDPAAARGMVRAMIAQVAVFHSPEDVRVCVCAPPDRMQRWDWLKWLPHNLHPTAQDAAGPVRLMAPSLRELEGMLGTELTGRPRFSSGKAGSLPYHVVIVDGVSVSPDDQLGGDGVDGVTLIDVTGAIPARRTRRSCGCRWRGAGWTCWPGTGPAPTSCRGSGCPTGSRWPRRRRWPVNLPRCARRLAPRQATTCSRRTPRLPRCSAWTIRSRLTWRRCGARVRPAAGSGSRLASTPAASRSSWTSRSRRKAAWGRTGSSSARRAQANPSCSGRWCSASR